MQWVGRGLPFHPSGGGGYCVSLLASFLNRRLDVLNRWCVRNGLVDAGRWVRADDMVMSSLPSPKDDDAASSLPDAMYWVGRGLPSPPLAESDVEGREM